MTPQNLKFLRVGIALLLLTAGSAAHAQLKTAAVARIKQLNKMAMDNYDSLEFDAAKKQLLEALKLATQANVTDKSMLATTHLNLGVVYGAGFNDETTATKHFTAALRLDRKLTVTASRATPSLEKMFKAAKEALGPPVPEAGAFQHTVVDESPSGQDINIKATAKASLRASRVLLFYRKSGTTSFIKSELGRYSGGVYQGTIPGSYAQGRSIYYYLEAQDNSGGRLAGSGEAASPNIISITKGGQISKPQKGGDGSGQGGSGQGGGKPTPPSGNYNRISISVMAGAGGGLVFGGDSENVHGSNKVDITPGGAVTPFHIAAEVGFNFSPAWQMSGLFRLQIVTATSGSDTEDKLSFMGLLRAKRFFGSGLVKPFLSFGAGGGQLRHRIPLGDFDKTPGDDDIVDARVAGVVAIAFGGGLQVDFSDHVGFVVDVIGLITAPDFAAHADLNLGLVVGF
jgi:hypothetical protein